MKGQALIRVERLTKAYRMGTRRVEALRGVDFCVHEGQFVALMGASGSGKSTLLHLLGCLDTPTSGTYWFGGEDVGSLSADARSAVRSRHMGFVFQAFNLLPRQTTLDNVLLPLLYQRCTRQAKERATEALARVGLADRARHRPSELSGGEQQRVAIARALIVDPPLLLADEPTGNLDRTTGDGIMRLLSDLHAEGRTIVMVTHDVHIADYAGRVLYMQDGRLIDKAGGE